MMNESNWVGLGQTGVVGDDVMHDVMALKAHVSALARVMRWRVEWVTYPSQRVNRHWQLPEPLVVRGSAWMIIWAWNFQVLQIRARWIKWWFPFSELVAQFTQKWRRRPRFSKSMVVRGLTSGPEIFKFGRSWADESSGGIGFVKFFQDLRKFEWEIRGSLGICGRAWRSVMVPLCTSFSRFCCSKSLEDFCGLIFCEILSEVLEIWKRRWQALLNLLPF